mmetsp:Transcript_103424/g.205578  ORF Transcript_103424/g.205578 Transcript_103424/m.205578 type:complete len:89 (+) Transcript_103424:55-321(+)
MLRRRCKGMVGLDNRSPLIAKQRDHLQPDVLTRSADHAKPRASERGPTGRRASLDHISKDPAREPKQGPEVYAGKNSMQPPDHRYDHL